MTLIQHFKISDDTGVNQARMYQSEETEIVEPKRSITKLKKSKMSSLVGAFNPFIFKVIIDI